MVETDARFLTGQRQFGCAPADAGETAGLPSDSKIEEVVCQLEMPKIIRHGASALEDASVGLDEVFGRREVPKTWMKGVAPCAPASDAGHDRLPGSHDGCDHDSNGLFLDELLPDHGVHLMMSSRRDDLPRRGLGGGCESGLVDARPCCEPLDVPAHTAFV